MKNIILLIAGIVVTLLYVIFGDSLSEAVYYEREFSNEMYNEALYFPVVAFTAVVAWGVAAIYYYVINSVRFSRWHHWLIMLVCAMAAALVFAYAYPNGVFAEMGYDFSAQLRSFAVVEMAIEAVLFVVSSFAIRWWSSNCRHTPIPE